MKIILHSDSLNLISYWEKILSTQEYKSVDDINSLLDCKDAIILINYTACDNRCEDIIKILVGNGNRVLILDRTPELSRAKKLLYLGAMGYGNALMRDHFFLAAIQALQEGMIWLHPELTSQLILELPSKQNNDNDKVLQKLTQREKEVALLLKEGLTYNEIADKLNISARTVKAHSQAIYKKLEVKDRLGLALLLK
jgi:RNA polymerase sigma factor (sigma-70 family)